MDSNPPTNQSTTPSSQEIVDSMVPTPPPKSKKKLILILALVLILIGVIFLVRRISNNTPAKRRITEESGPVLTTGAPVGATLPTGTDASEAVPSTAPLRPGGEL